MFAVLGLIVTVVIVFLFIIDKFEKINKVVSFILTLQLGFLLMGWSAALLNSFSTEHTLFDNLVLSLLVSLYFLLSWWLYILPLFGIYYLFRGLVKLWNHYKGIKT